MNDSVAVATRLDISTLAKLYDALINRGVKPDQLTSISQILRLAVFTVIIDHKPLNTATSAESIKVINYLLEKRTK
mgnify:CR=1 FL=1